MNSRSFAFSSLLATMLTSGCGTVASSATSPAPEPPVPAVNASRPAAAPAPAAENQRLYGPGSATVIPAEVAKSVVEKFRDAYSQPGAPRLVIYVNRALVDTVSGMKLSGRTEKYSTARTSAKSDMEIPAAPANAAQTQVNVAVGGGNAGAGAANLLAGKGTASTETTNTSGENTYSLRQAAAPTLADQQTVREIERLFGRVFRTAGAQLADQNAAASLMADKPDRLAGTTDQAAKDREVLGQIADIAIEVLISSRQITIPTVAGDETLAAPDIQATAIRLKDAAIVGQASASDILGKDRQSGRILKQFDARDITEATALALMEDMLLGK